MHHNTAYDDPWFDIEYCEDSEVQATFSPAVLRAILRGQCAANEHV